jgi:uncharacterized membrane protein
MAQKFLASATLIWLLVLAGGWWSAHTGRATWFGSAVYVGAGRVCHQRPERSFQTAGVQWPVCGRCAGLYLAAPFGAFAAMLLPRRRTPRRGWFLLAALPTAATFMVEWLHLAPMTSTIRALAALPLGAAVAYMLVAATSTSKPGTSSAIG